MESSVPLVSVVIPALNEERWIGECLRALTSQTYSRPAEILVVDGGSTDSTRSVVSSYASRESRIRLLENPSGRTADALNTGINTANGSVIVRMDAHAVPALDYIEQCVRALAETSAACVGGRMQKVGGSAIGAAIAAAATSRFGIGNSAFHYATNPQAVESVYLGCWPRATFDHVGLFDTELVRNQDDELSYRIREAGGTIWFDPRIRVEYHGRESLSELFSQYFQYGYWKIRVFRSHPGALRWRHLVPGLFVGVLVIGAALVPFSSIARRGLAAVLTTYAVASFVVGGRVARRSMGIRTVHLVGAFAAMHCGYGSGLWMGLARFLRRKHPPSES